MLNLQVSSASLFDCVGCKIGLVRASARFVIYVFLCVCIGYFIIGTVIGLFGIRGLYRQLGSVSQSAVIKCLGGGAYNEAVQVFTNFNKAYDSVNTGLFISP